MLYPVYIFGIVYRRFDLSIANEVNGLAHEHGARLVLHCPRKWCFAWFEVMDRGVVRNLETEHAVLAAMSHRFPLLGSQLVACI